MSCIVAVDTLVISLVNKVSHVIRELSVTLIEFTVISDNLAKGKKY